jgi:uncharacterized membrane protein
VRRLCAWLGEGWQLVGADLPVFSVAAFLAISLSLLSGFILALPLAAGLCIMFAEKLQGNKPSLSHLWEGLSSRFPATISIWMLYLVAALPFYAVDIYLHTLGGAWAKVGIGVDLAGLLLVATPLFFTVPLIADRDLSAQEALRLSWAQVRPRKTLMLSATVLYALVLLAGFFACGVGVILTLPVVVGAQVLAYRELFEGFEVPRMTPLREPEAAEEEQ